MAKKLMFELKIEVDMDTTLTRSAKDIGYRLVDVAKDLKDKGDLKGQILDPHGHLIGSWEFTLPRE